MDRLLRLHKALAEKCGQLRLFHIHPLFGASRFENVVAAISRAEPMTEIRAAFFCGWIVEQFEEPRKFVEERMLVTDAKAWNPHFPAYG